MHQTFSFGDITAHRDYFQNKSSLWGEWELKTCLLHLLLNNCIQIGQTSRKKALFFSEKLKSLVPIQCQAKPATLLSGSIMKWTDKSQENRN